MSRSVSILKMANYYTFRVDEVDGVTRESVVSFLIRNVERHVVCREISDVTKKPHYQGWVYTDLSVQTFQNRIKSQWPSVRGTTRGRSSGHYSTSPVKKDTYQAYCLKGTATEMPDVVSMQLGVSEEIDIETIHRQWWSKQASTPTKAVHIVEEGIAVFQSYDWGHRADDMCAKRQEVAEWIVNKYEGKGVNSFLIKNYINGILCFTCPDYKRQFIQQVALSDRW